MGILGPHFHVGIVVADIDAARTQLSEQLGVTWGAVLRLDEVGYRDASGADVVLPTTMCYSTEEPHLELIEEVPGSIWVCNDHSNIHHVGFWADDLAATSGAMARGGCPLQLCGRIGDDAPASFAYHGNDVGVRVEVVDASIREAMSFLFRPEER